MEEEDEDDDDDDEDEMPLDMEDVENASKKARQEEEIHSEHVQVRIINMLLAECDNKMGKFDCLALDGAVGLRNKTRLLSGTVFLMR